MSLWKVGLNAKAKAIHTLRDPAVRLDMANRMMDEKNSIHEDWTLPDPSAGPSLQRALQQAHNYVTIMGNRILEAEPIVVSTDIMDRLVSTYNGQYGAESRVPTHRKLPRMEDLPAKYGLIVMERPVIIGDEDSHLILRRDPVIPRTQVFAPINAVFYATGEYGGRPALVTRIFMDHRMCSWSEDTLTVNEYACHVPRPWSWHLSAGAYDVLEDIVPSDDRDMRFLTRWTVCFLLTLWDYMGQRIDALERVTPDKQAVKLGRKLNLSPVVQIVRWRKEESRTPEPDHVPGTVDWQCRWTVHSHTRHYKSGKVVTVPSYTKGPPGKPYKASNTRINVVDR